jgi:hypothetical protein
MKTNKIPSLALAAVLQLVPVCRVATVNPAIATSSFAIVARCAAAIAALLGSVDAVSGASANAVYVAGVQSLLPSAPGVTTNITRPTGSPMVLRIILGGNVGLQPELDYFNATPLPPGLMINTNVNTNSVGGQSTNYYIYGTPTQAGVWFPVTVSAGNLLYAGLASTNIIITITNASGVSPPTITTQPQSKTVTNSSSASFTVVATGATTYQWRKNNTNLVGATSATYTIGTTTTNSAGIYSVVVSNSTGPITSSNATLTVLDPPGIITQPQSVAVGVGSNATFQVVAAGIPPPAYQWRFNGTLIAGATASSFTISGAQPANDGDYSVVVSNSVNTITSTSAHLTVLYAPTLSNTQMEGGKAAFDVSGPANIKVVILSSADLAGWTPLRTNVTASGDWHFLDSNSPPAAARFYRGLLQP